MNIEAMMFADRAAIVDGLLGVERAGWEFAQYDFFPATIVGFVAGILALDETQHGEVFEIELDLFSDDGQVVGSSGSMIASGTRPKVEPGVPLRVPFAIAFMTAARGPTVLKARLSHDGKELDVIACSVRGTLPDSVPDDL